MVNDNRFDTKNQSWLTLAQAADYLNIGQTKLRDLVNKKKIPAERIDKQWRFKNSELDRWMSMSKSTEGYFQNIQADILENDNLREPQKVAYSKLRDFLLQAVNKP